MISHILALVLFLMTFGHGQSFLFDQTLSDSLPQSKANSIKIVDVNRDGVHDVLMSGYDASRYGIFLDVMYGSSEGNLGLGLEYEFITYPDTIGEYTGGLGNVTLADVNRDGNVDAYLNGSAKSFLLMNFLDGLEVSTGIEDLTLTYSNAAFADVDMNGTPDLFIMGVDETQDLILNRLYLNDGNRLDYDPTPNFPDLINGTSQWVDYDNDGDNDLLISGNTADYKSSVTRFFKNEPSGRLIEDTNQDIIGLKAGVVKFVDLDSDGDQDLILSGWNILENKLVTKVYQNEPLGTFIDMSVDFGHAVAYGDIDAVDIDMDGDLDIAISGADSVQNFATQVHSQSGKIYINNGGFQFTELVNISGARIIRFADVNGDLRPDLIANGTTELDNIDSSFTKVLLNQGSFENDPPSPPSALTSFAISTRAIFTWGSGQDQTDNDASLRYNVRIGSQSGGYDLLSPTMEYSTANIGQRLIKEFELVPHGTYYWSVQTIDATGIASSWSEEDTLFISRLVSSTQSLPGVYFSSAGWADYNDDGELDLALTGINFSGSSITKFHLNQDQLLEQDLSQNVEAVFGGQLTWVDYTNDGLLDLSLSGFQIINFSGFPATAFYVNQNGTFVFDQQEDVTDEVYGYTMGINGGQNNHSWGDYDNDGDQDFVIGGVDYFGNRHLSVFVNKDGSLSRDTTQNALVPLFPCMVQWVDIQGDGYVDLVTIGADSLGSLGMRVYENDSLGVLNLSSTWSDENIGVTAGAFEFADYNDDNRIDFALIGNDASNNSISKIFTNNGAQFVIANASHNLKGVYSGRPSWGDYDNDGDLDLLIAGLFNDAVSGDPTPFSGLYYQELDQFLLDTTVSIDSLGYSFTEFGDYDGDGDLDLFAAGVSSNADVTSKVFDNLENITNQNLPPNEPYGLNVVSIDRDRVHLTWETPSDGINPLGGFTSSEGLSFQLQLGNDDVSNEHQIISGSYGNLGSGTIETNFKYVNDMPEGNYTWMVRSVDHGKVRSDWSAKNYFYIDITPPTIDTIRTNYLTDKDLIIIVKFKEDFYLDLSIDPIVTLFHPETSDIDFDGVSDSLLVVKQSYTGDEWTGSVTLPENYSGKAVLLRVANTTDQRNNMMDTELIYKTPASIISQSGGTSISEDGNVFILLPQGALSADVSLSIMKSELLPSLSDSISIIGDIYDIEPNDVVLNKPAIIRMMISEQLSDNEAPVYIGNIDKEGNLLPLGGSEVTIADNRYLQVQTFQMGSYGIFSSVDPVFSDSTFSDKLECQPRIFTPSGNLFEFNKTNILYSLEDNIDQDVKVRIFNLAGRLKRILTQDNPSGSGNQLIVWDGKDHDGSVVPSGMYIVTLEREDKILRTTVGVLNR
ncbi:MAG: hypothetical protein ACJZ12_00060 [Candidatus Neomarinimicrobiota bacterium]